MLNVKRLTMVRTYTCKELHSTVAYNHWIWSVWTSFIDFICHYKLNSMSYPSFSIFTV